jgi:hypothetical protein
MGMSGSYAASAAAGRQPPDGGFEYNDVVRDPVIGRSTESDFDLSLIPAGKRGNSRDSPPPRRPPMAVCNNRALGSPVCRLLCSVATPNSGGFSDSSRSRRRATAGWHWSRASRASARAGCWNSWPTNATGSGCGCCAARPRRWNARCRSPRSRPAWRPAGRAPASARPRTPTPGTSSWSPRRSSTWSNTGAPKARSRCCSTTSSGRIRRASSSCTGWVARSGSSRS